jgi:hypothetical protein
MTIETFKPDTLKLDEINCNYKVVKTDRTLGILRGPQKKTQNHPGNLDFELGVTM